MADHSVVFNMRIQMPGAKPGAGQVSYEQMMNTFDRTRRDGEKEGWVKALTALREAVEKRSDKVQSGTLLEDLIAEAARTCTLFRETP